MGMDMHVQAIREEDERYRKMVAVREACYDAHVALPEDVDDYFFNDCDGLVIDEHELRKLGAVEDYGADAKQGFDVIVSKLPLGTKRVRFYCSW